VVWVCEAESVEAIHRLKYHGANITKQQVNTIPLHFASFIGNHGVISALINLGADMHATIKGITPLITAVFWHQ
jgi:Ankyrin repeat